MDLYRENIHTIGFTRMSPGALSKGNQPKYTNGQMWVKTNYLGYEDLAEYFTCKLLECSNIVDFVDYRLCTFNNENACYSLNMLSPNETLITLSKILNIYNISQDDLDRMNSLQSRIDTVLDIIKDYTNLDISTYLGNLLALDAVILNEDRHLNNIALIYDERSNIFRTAPIFDNGSSFLSDISDYPLYTATIINMRNVKAKPFSSSFKKQYDFFHPTVRFDLSKVNSLISQIDSLDNVYTKRIAYVLKQSITKYPELFFNKIIGWDS